VLSGTLVAILTTIAASLSSILGVAIGVVLVTLQLLRVTYSGNAVREVLRQHALRELFLLYLVTICIAMAALLTVGDPVEPRTVGLLYLAVGLFFASLVALPNALVRFLTLTRVTSEHVRRLVEMVDAHSAASVARNRADWAGVAEVHADRNCRPIAP
jgi:uncharacterized membrane protein